MISLSDGTTTIELHKDLKWIDEFTYNTVGQTSSRGITGTAIVQSKQMVGGRPITLQSEDDKSAPHTREKVEALRNWAAVAGLTLTLTIRGEARQVKFRHQDIGFEAEPWIHYDEMEDTDLYLCIFRFQETP